MEKFYGDKVQIIILTQINKRCCNHLNYFITSRWNLCTIRLSKQGKLCLFAPERNPQLAIISAENGNGSLVLFRRPRNFTFHPFHSRPASATTAFYPICQRYKLILISEQAHAGFLGREGRVGFIGIRVTRCDVIIARSTGAPAINAATNRASEL